MYRFNTIQELNTFINNKLSQGITLQKLMKILSYIGNDWLKYKSFNIESFNKILVEKSNLFETYIITWNKNQESPIQDHPENGCIMFVLEGSLKEVVYNDKLQVLYTTNYVSGDVSYIEGATKLHKIIPLEHTVTLHVYAPPNFVYKSYLIE